MNYSQTWFATHGREPLTRRKVLLDKFVLEINDLIILYLFHCDPLCIKDPSVIIILCFLAFF
jgi:hypothetical protein